MGVAATASGALMFIRSAVDSAGTLNETISKIGQVFGKSATGVNAMAEDMAKQFGSVKTETLDAAAAFGLIAQGAGLTESASAKLSVSLVRLADDAASFYDKPLDVALQKLRSGLVGEAEPLREFGVLLSETAVKARALKDGAVLVNGELSETDKVMTRVKLIQEGLAKAMGDHERTMPGYKNQVKLLTGQFEELKTSIGEIAIGPATTGVGFLSEVVGVLKTRISGNIPGTISPSVPLPAAAPGTTITAPEPSMKSLNPMAGDMARYQASIFGGGGLGGPFGMMGTLGMGMNQKAAGSGIDKQIRDLQNEGWASGHSFASGSLHKVAQEAILDTSKDKQIKELQDIKKVLEGIEKNTTKNVISEHMRLSLEGRE